MNLLLADDDKDDCIFFREALEELPVATKLVTVNDGVELMEHLSKKETVLPDVLYLDLNMPRKNGMECLSEIKLDEKFKQLPVIIFSTSFNPEIADQLHESGARFYIRKPPEFGNLKKIILKSLNLIAEKRNERTTKENFLITWP